MSNTLERFMQKVEMIPIAGCWLYCTANEASFWLTDCTEKANRVSWILHRGPIPAGMWVLHACSVSACVNPHHLFLGDKTASMRAMARKGRQVYQAHPAKIRRGEDSVHAKLTTDDVRKILMHLSRGVSYAEIARRFKVSKSTISFIKAGRTWRHITRETA